MCVGCRKRAPKHSLLRLTSNAEGTLCVDAGNKAEGRGAWICDKEGCLHKAIERKAFPRALRRAVRLGDMDALRAKIAEALGNKLAMIIHGAQRNGALKEATNHGEAHVVIEGTTPSTGWRISDGQWLENIQAALEKLHRWDALMIDSGQNASTLNGRC